MSQVPGVILKRFWIGLRTFSGQKNVPGFRRNIEKIQSLPQDILGAE